MVDLAVEGSEVGLVVGKGVKEGEEKVVAAMGVEKGWARRWWTRRRRTEEGSAAEDLEAEDLAVAREEALEEVG